MHVEQESLPGAVDRRYAESIRVLSSRDEMVAFVAFHLRNSLARESAYELAISLLGETPTHVRKTESLLPAVLEAAFVEVGQPPAVLNSTTLDDLAEDAFWWCLDRLSSKTLVIVSPSIAGAGRPRPDPFIQAFVTALKADVIDACEGPVRKNLTFAGIDEASRKFLEESVANALSEAPIRCHVIHALARLGVSRSGIEELIRRSATLMRSDELAQGTEGKVGGLVEKWIEDSGLTIPRILWVCVGTADGKVRDDAGYIPDFLWARAQHLKYSPRKSFAETNVGTTGALVDIAE